MSVEVLASAAPAERRPRPAPVHVLLVVSSLEAGGAERQVVELARGLDRRRFLPIVCSLSDVNPLAAELRDAECEFAVVRKRWKYDFTLVTRLRRLIAERGISVVHAFLFDAEIAARLASPPGVAVISSERNADYRVPASHRLAQRLTRDRFDLLVANSQAGRRFACDTLRVPAERIRVVRNGVDTEYFQPCCSIDLRRELKIPADAPVIGMIAAFKRQKRHGDFFALAERVLKRFPRCRFICAGEPLRNNHQGAGDYHAEMRRVIRERNLTDRVLFLGRRGDMPAVYSLCDLTVLPSEHEGTPNALLESLACERPAIATNIADNAHILRDGETGYICAVGDVETMAARAVDLLESPGRRTAMGRAARAHVQAEFSCAVMVERMQAVYAEALRMLRLLSR